MIRNLILISSLLIGTSLACAQSGYVGRFDIYEGFAFLDSPDIHLSERGFQLQAGMRPRRWLSLGFDYSVTDGNTTIVPSYLTTALQQQLAAELAPLAQAGVIPPGFTPSIPIHSTTQTFAAGPQLDWHRFKFVTLFIRPSIGAIRETATVNPGDPISNMIAAQLAPSGHKLDLDRLLWSRRGRDFSSYRSSGFASANGRCAQSSLQ